MAATRAKKTDGSKDEKWHYAGSPNPAPPAGTPANAGWISPRWKKIYASNITADPETGIGKWTEADFMRAMKTGITPDGVCLTRRCGGIISKRSRIVISDPCGVSQDGQADPEHAAEKYSGESKVIECEMIAKILLYLSSGALSLLVAACALQSGQERIHSDWEQPSYFERGQYLVNYLGHCTGCHTPLGPYGQSDTSLFLSGVPAKFAGAKAGPPQVAGFPGPRGARVYAKNITPDEETGIGRWSEEQFVRTFKTGVSPAGVKYVISCAQVAALSKSGHQRTQMLVEGTATTT